MPSLVNITQNTPNSVQVWGFHDPCDKNLVKAAVTHIAGLLDGDNHVIHIMSGTHGYCSGKVGAVASPEKRFYEEDKEINSPQTRGGSTVTLKVHDFNNGDLGTYPDHVSAAMSKLNTCMRSEIASPGTHTFLLAYCCSAGTRS